MKSSRNVVVVLSVALIAGSCVAQTPRSATDLAFDMYHSCLKDFSTSCVKPKAMQWFDDVLAQNEIILTDKLSIVRTSNPAVPMKQRSSDSQEGIFDNIDEFLATHALRIQAPDYFRSTEARSLIPDFLMDNALTRGALVPLGERSEGRGYMRKVILPFLLGLKLKTTVLVPLALALIALKTWKAMTLGLLSLVLSGALVIFKIAKPKIVNYEVVHYPQHHVDHIEHLPHHIEHIVPHHVEHVVPHHVEHVVPHHVEHIVPHHLEHHLDHHIDLPHHVEHIEHVEHTAPGWDPHAWARSSQEPQDAQDMAYNAQRRR